MRSYCCELCKHAIKYIEDFNVECNVHGKLSYLNKYKCADYSEEDYIRKDRDKDMSLLHIWSIR